jgi:UDPglucose 6-dehydrogenase
MKLTIIGAGVVGKATGIGFSRYAHEVVFYDIDARKTDAIAAKNIRVASSLQETLDSDIHFICVNTPLVNHHYDLSFLKSAVVELAGSLVKEDKYHLVVVRSTLLPCTMENEIIPLFRARCVQQPGHQPELCYNPEFLREATALENFLHPPIIVIGESSKQSGDILSGIYEPFKAPVLRTAMANAEAIKCFSNAYNSMKISFFNLLFLLTQNINLDHEVIEHALVKASLGINRPSDYTSGGYPFGGNCLPKDLAALTAFLKEKGIDSKLFEAVAEINCMVQR